MRRWLRVALVLSGVAALSVCGTVAAVETRCTGAPSARAPRPATFGIEEPGYRRAEADSFITYPEWNIVHAYSDLADVTRQGSESDFDYAQAVNGFWSSLCRATAVASGGDGATTDQRVTNYIIGFSFTAEMVVQGLYERTLGALTARWRGGEKTAEDAFAQRVLDEYAGFLQQTPWYRFPFGARLAALWRETPFVASVRSVERRGALSLQYAGKAVYAAAIGFLAGYAPADLTIRSVVADLDDSDAAADPRIRRIREVAADDGRRGVLIETPRYQAFTEIVRGLGVRQRRLLEIAGNRRILTTVLVPAGTPLPIPGTEAVFSLPIQSRPGSRRVGLDTPVPTLAAQVGAVERAGGRFEHAYDY